MYKKPVVLRGAELFEGVYAGSGDCYKATAYIHQTPELGRETYKIQINARHDADHNSNAQEFHITFNQPVNYGGCYMNGATLKSGDGSSTLVISLSYWNNHTDNIGGGDLEVSAGDGLAIISYEMVDVGKQY